MAKLYNAYEHPKEKIKRNNRKYKHRRFYSNLEMSIIKHDEAVHNSETKRGSTSAGNNHVIYECGCGCRGCFLHRNYTATNENSEGISLLRNIMNKTKPIKKDSHLTIKWLQNDLIMRRNGFDENSFKK